MSDSYNFFANPASGGLSFEQLKQRRAIAQALASRGKGFPKTKGEGMTYLGESIGEALQDFALHRAEQKYNTQVGKDISTLRTPQPGATVTTPPETPVVPKVDTPPPPPVTAPAPVVAPPPPVVTPPPAVVPPAPAVVPPAPAVVPPAPAVVPPAPAPAASPDDAGESWSPPGGSSSLGDPNAAISAFMGGNEKPDLRDKISMAMLSGGGDAKGFTAPDAVPPPAPAPDVGPPAPPDVGAVRSLQSVERVPLPPERPAQIAALPPAAPEINVAQTAPVSAPDVPLPMGDPRTVGGVRSTVEATAARGGMNPTAIAGLMPNIRDESGFNPTLSHWDPTASERAAGKRDDSTFSHGLYQERGEEWNKYKDWVDKNYPGYDWRDPKLQTQFLTQNLQTPQYQGTFDRMQTADRPGTAAASFVSGYLKPAKEYENARVAAYLGGGAGQGPEGSTQVATGGGGGPGGVRDREGAPVDQRDLITEAMLAQPPQQQAAQEEQPQQPQTSDARLLEMLGGGRRPGSPFMPTAALGRAGVATDAPSTAIAPMGTINQDPMAASIQDRRDAITKAVIDQPTTAPEVPQPDPTQSGPSVPTTLAALTTGSNPVVSSDISPPATPAPAPPPAPPPTVVAENAPPPPAAAAPPAIPGPLAPPVARPPTPLQAQPETPAQFAKPLGERPKAPDVPPISQAELNAQRVMSQYPDNPGVQARAQKALEDAEKQRMLPYQRDVERWKVDTQRWDKQYEAWQEQARKQPQEDIDLRVKRQELADKEAAAARSTRLGGIPDAVFAAQIEKSADASKGIPGATQAIANARQAIKSGMYTGAAADVELQLGKIARAAGYEPKDSSKLANTEAFRAYMAGVTAQARQNLVGSNQISNADLAASQQASGGKITMEPESVLKILDSLERINTASAVQHQGKLLAYSGDDPNAQRAVFGTFGLPMENVVPQGAKDLLFKNPTPEVQADFDRTFNTPGLAQRILKYR